MGCPHHKALGTNLSFSTAFHPQIGGQTERVNQILEDMLHARVLSYGTKIAIKLAYKWPPLKPYMVVNAEPHSTGRRLEKAKYLVLMLSRKPKSKCN
jgi:hypothetical protein